VWRRGEGATLIQIKTPMGERGFALSRQTVANPCAQAA
jgi:hypothetical protein